MAYLLKPDLPFVHRNRLFFGAQSGELVNKLSKAIENQQMGLKEVEERILQFLYHSPARSFNRGTSPLFHPIQLQFSMIYSTVSEIEVDQLLVRNSGLARHVFEVRYGIPIKSNGNWLFQSLCIWVLPSPHLRKIIMISHLCRLP